MTPSTTWPAPSSSTSSQARFTAGRVFRGSRPFSNLALASVRMPRARAPLRMQVPSKLGGLKDHVGGVGDDLGVLAAHDAGKAHRPVLVGDDQVARGEGVLLAVQGGKGLPSSARRTMIFPPFT